MKHLIKQYSHFLGEIIRPGKVFPNSPQSFYHSIDLNHFRLDTNFPLYKKKPTETHFLLAFFWIKELKNQTIK